MKIKIYRVKPIKHKPNGMYFLHFKWFNGKYYFLYWEANFPIFWLPKIQKGRKIKRVVWLFFAVGFARDDVGFMFK